MIRLGWEMYPHHCFSPPFLPLRPPPPPPSLPFPPFLRHSTPTVVRSRGGPGCVSIHGSNGCVPGRKCTLYTHSSSTAFLVGIMIRRCHIICRPPLNNQSVIGCSAEVCGVLVLLFVATIMMIHLTTFSPLLPSPPFLCPPPYPLPSSGIPCQRWSDRMVDPGCILFP